MPIKQGSLPWFLCRNRHAKKRKKFIQAEHMIALQKDDRLGNPDFGRETLAERGASWLKKFEVPFGQTGIDI